jgi:hypothetical protein
MALSCARNSHSLGNSGLHPQTIALLLVSFDVVDSAELVSTWFTREAPKRFAGLLPVLLGFLVADERPSVVERYVADDAWGERRHREMVVMDVTRNLERNVWAALERQEEACLSSEP